MKKGTCRKCGKYGFLVNHHIVPFKKKYKDKRTIEICPDCHAEVHEILPNDCQSKEFYESFFVSWLYGLFKNFH
jgi:predicted HNH restriction endonuclease